MSSPSDARTVAHAEVPVPPAGTSPSPEGVGISEATRRETRDLVLNDLYAFARIVLGLDYLYGPVHYPLCEFLQKNPKRALVVLPRGFLKTSVCSKAYPIWRACRNPEIRILIVSNSEPNAKKMISQIKQVFERNRVFQELFPDLIPDFAHGRWSDLAAEVNRDASIGYQEATFEAAGVGSNVVSRHYDLIIEDDTLSPRKDDVTGEELMPMKEEVDQVIGWHKLATSLLINPAESEVLVVGTRWAYHDLLGNIMKEQPEYLRHERVAEEDDVAAYPTRFSIPTLRQIEKDQGTYMYNALYMNRPVSAEKQLFKPEWLRTFDLAPPNLRKFMSVDLAISQKDGADYNVIVVGGTTEHGKLFILDYARLRGTPRDVLDAMFQFIKEHPEIERCALEAIAYQQAMTYMMADRMVTDDVFLTVDPIKRREKSKEARIQRLQPLMMGGRFYIRPHHRELKNELMEFPYGRHDDVVDATSDLVPYLNLPEGPVHPEELPDWAQDPFKLENIMSALEKRGQGPYPFDVQTGRVGVGDTTWLTKD